MKKKYIMYIGGFELPDKNAAAHRVLSNAKIFRELGKEVVFVGVDKNKVRRENTFEIYQGFQSYAVSYPANLIEWFDYLTNIGKYLKIFEQYKDEIEMVIMYNFQSVAMKRMMKYCNENGIKCCADITEWRSARGENFIYRIFKDTDTWYRMRILNNEIDNLIVISSFLEHYYKNNKVVINIPALVDLSEKKWKNNYSKSSNVLRLVYAGNPGKKDRLDILIESLRYVTRDWELDIIGITKDDYLQNFPDQSDFINDNFRICFHGCLSHLETLEYVKKANYSCFFRSDNRVSKAGFPTKLVEAISCETPIITNNTSDIGNYVNNQLNGVMLFNNNPYEIASILNNVPMTMCVEKDKFDYRSYITLVKESGLIDL